LGDIVAVEQIVGSNAPQRMNALVGIPALLDEFGVKLQDALDGIAIDPRAFDDQDYRIPYSVSIPRQSRGLYDVSRS